MTLDNQRNNITDVIWISWTSVRCPSVKFKVYCCELRNLHFGNRWWIMYFGPSDCIYVLFKWSTIRVYFFHVWWNIFHLSKQSKACRCTYSCAVSTCIRIILIINSLWSHGVILCLTHWGRDKMAAFFQTTFSNTFAWMRMFEFRLRSQWNLFLRFQQKYPSIILDNGLAPIKQ